MRGDRVGQPGDVAVDSAILKLDLVEEQYPFGTIDVLSEHVRSGARS